MLWDATAANIACRIRTVGLKSSSLEQRAFLKEQVKTI